MNKLLMLFLSTSLFTCSKFDIGHNGPGKPEPHHEPEWLPGPNIVSVSGAWTDNDTVVITGVQFGSKATGTPVGWDNMETGGFNPVWTARTGLSINTTNNRHARSSYNAFHDFKSGVAGNGYFTGGSDSPTWFVQYWFKLDDNFDWGNSTYGGANANLSNVKYFRMWTTGSASENFVIATHGFSGGRSIWTNEYIDSSSGYFWNTSGQTTHNEMTKGVWHSLEFEFKDSDVNVPNGEIRVWFDGVKKLDVNNMITRKASSSYKRPYHVGFYDSWNDSNTDSDFYYIDDAYIDNSWSRVALGNAASYASCTVREIQPTRSWSGTSITVKANPGSFTSGQTAYLYVLDSVGVANANGFPVTIP